MAAVLCFSLAACGNNSELEKYEKYETLIDYLEAEDYESALAEMVKISGNADILENDEQDYFEFQTQMDLYRNDFGEIDNPGLSYRIQLKEEFANDSTTYWIETGWVPHDENIERNDDHTVFRVNNCRFNGEVIEATRVEGIMKVAEIKRGSSFVPASSPKGLFVTLRDKRHPCQVRRWGRPNLREHPPRPCQERRRFQGRPARDRKHSRRDIRIS